VDDAGSRLDAGAAIIRLSTAVGERVLQARAASGLTARQLQVLRLAVGGIRMSALARGLGTPKSTMTSVIDQLEALGLAARGADQGDGRGQVVGSTATGEARLREFDTTVAARVDALVATLTPARQRQLRELMSRLPSATVPVPLSGPR